MKRLILLVPLAIMVTGILSAPLARADQTKCYPIGPQVTFCEWFSDNGDYGTYEIHCNSDGSCYRD